MRQYVVGIGAMLAMAGLGAGGQASADQRSPYADFPLYKDVSGNGPIASLGEGQLPNGTRWGAWASRVGAGRRGYEQPCLSLARITRFGEYTDVHGCGQVVSVDDQEAAHYAPNYAYIGATYQTRPDGPFVGETVLGLTFHPSVRSVVLEYAGGGQLQRRTRLFNSKQQKKTKLPPFRYIALALQDDVCAETVVGYGKDGAELFSAETVLCSDGVYG
ncbi:MAG TPA: hypothetical protein VFS54_00360 [Solirubrobacterales bacterium]|nr:hypothetical protein [Solirubrobacterales bacterium]